jgi:uncharacterized protein
MQDMIRLDRGNMLRFTRTPEGYLRGEAIVSKTGVFPYINADGSTRWELRHPDDILTQDTLDSIKQIPVTLEHPAGLVTSENAKALQVGFIGDTVRIDGPNIIAGFTITDAATIAEIERGKRGLSLGYKVDLKEEAGTYNGQTYTHRQRMTQVNHLAVVTAGRVGPEARINLDGAAVCIQGESEMTDKTLAQVRLDGITYDAAPEVANALTKAQEAVTQVRADAETTKAEMQKRIDGLQAQIDEAKAKLAEVETQRGDAAVAEMVKARVGLIATASRIVKDSADLASLSERAIMEAAIKVKHDSIDLTGKSDDYVRARFDSIVEGLGDDAARAQVRDATAPRADGAQMDARAVMADGIRNQWQKKGA